MPSSISSSRRSRARILFPLFSILLGIAAWTGAAQAKIASIYGCELQSDSYPKPQFPSQYKALCQRFLKTTQAASEYKLDIKDYPECTTEDKGLQQQCADAVAGAKMLKEWIGIITKQSIETHEDPICAENRRKAIELGYDWSVSCTTLTDASGSAWGGIATASKSVFSNALSVASEGNFYPSNAGGPNLPDRSGGDQQSDAWKQLRAWQEATSAWWEVVGIPVGDQKFPCWDAAIKIQVSSAADYLKEVQATATRCVNLIDITLPKLLAALNGSLVRSEGQKACPPDAKPGTVCLPSPLSTTEVPVIAGRIINTALGVLGSFSLLMFIYGGVTWLTAYGSTEKIQKGRDIMTWAVLGLVLIFGSFALVRFVLGAFTSL